MNTKTIRHFGLSIFAGLIMTACGGDDPKSAAPAATDAGATPSTQKLSGSVNVYNWIEYIPDGMKDNFEKLTGLKVNYDTFETDEALNAKIIAGNSGYDVVVPGAAWAEVQIKQGKYQKLDKSKIPNLKNLDPALIAQIAKMDPGNQYLVPWAWGFTGVGINEAKVKKALGDTPMPENPFDLVFNPTYTNKLKSCGIFMLDSPTEVMPAALQYIGKDASSTNVADYDAALDMLKKVRPDVRKFGDSSVINEIADGNFCAFLAWSGDVNTAAERSGNKDIKVLLGHGGIVFFDTMAIPVDAKNVENAYAWINNSLDPKVGAEITNKLGYATANKAALEFVDKSKADNKTIFLTAENLAQMAPRRLPASPEANKAVNEAFRKFKTGK
ncbi:extracellular solute-binding protein [Hydromonas duriensis]|uniref:Putrescine-binding periplasmic protein n=1 Tax=Hydromonas duriensis TaxID=1527608 RepID=A0A4R6Y6L2_9BURK|nr:extracellular solute-binding protein [Hydromonas duriensis]TDR31156.1 spermidine/putrescine-binding protein [Hydromonas duriensis]